MQFTKDDFENLDAAIQEIYSGISADLETGSHHRNNAASKLFNDQHPFLMKALADLDKYLRTIEEKLEQEE